VRYLFGSGGTEGYRVGTGVQRRKKIERRVLMRKGGTGDFEIKLPEAGRRGEIGGALRGGSREKACAKETERGKPAGRSMLFNGR